MYHKLHNLPNKHRKRILRMYVVAVQFKQVGNYPTLDDFFLLDAATHSPGTYLSPGSNTEAGNDHPSMAITRVKRVTKLL